MKDEQSNGSIEHVPNGRMQLGVEKPNIYPIKSPQRGNRKEDTSSVSHMTLYREAGTSTISKSMNPESKQLKAIDNINESNVDPDYRKPHLLEAKTYVSPTFSLRRSFYVTPRAFSFSPAGFLIVYQLGVVSTLLHEGLVHSGTPLAGSSAGSIISMTLGMDIPVNLLLKGLYGMCDYARKHGTRGKLKYMVSELLDQIMTDEMVTKLNEREAPVTLGYTQVRRMRPLIGNYAREFKDTDDLKQVVVASCNIPLYTTRRWSTAVRGHQGIDGFFCTGISRFGCPPTTKSEEARICSHLTGRKAKKDALKNKIENKLGDVKVIPFNARKVFLIRKDDLKENSIISPHLRSTRLTNSELNCLKRFLASLRPLSRCEFGLDNGSTPKKSKITREMRKMKTGKNCVVDDDIKWYLPDMSVSFGCEKDDTGFSSSSFKNFDIPEPQDSSLSNTTASTASKETCLPYSDGLQEANHEANTCKAIVKEPKALSIPNNATLLRSALRPLSDKQIARYFKHGQVDACIWIIMEIRRLQMK